MYYFMNPLIEKSTKLGGLSDPPLRVVENTSQANIIEQFNFQNSSLILLEML